MSKWTNKTEKTSIVGDDLLLLGDSENLSGSDEINKTVKFSTIQDAYRVDYFGYNNNGTPDVLVIATPDTYQTFIPNPANITAFNSSEFSYNSTTGVITYSGEGTDELYKMVGNVSCENSSGLNGASVHFAIAVNGVIKFESEATLEGPGAIVSLGLSSFFMLSNGDEITVEIKASSAGTLSATHAQVFINEVNGAS